MNEKVFNTVADVFDESDGNVMTFDEAIANIREGKDVNHIIYYVQKLYQPWSEKGLQHRCYEGNFEIQHDDEMPFMNFCIYLDTIASKYNVVDMSYQILSDKQTVVFWMRLEKKEA